MNKWLFFLFFVCDTFSIGSDLDRVSFQYESSDQYLTHELRSDLSVHQKDIQALSVKLSNFQMKFERLNNQNLSFRRNMQTENNFTPEVQSSNGLNQFVINKDENINLITQKNSREKKYKRTNEIGFYILPFIALKSPGQFKFQSKLGALVIDQEVGFSTGWRMGLENRYFFIDSEFSYIRNRFNSLQSGLIQFPGETENFGLLLNSGLKYDIFNKTSIFFGGGFGAMNQEVGFDLNAALVEEEERTLFVYQIFAGINFGLAEHLCFGLRYRWMRVAEMELFSSRDLHLAELAFGYKF